MGGGLLLIIFWVAGIVLAPFLAAGDSWRHSFIYFIYEPVCHQMPERSLTLNNFPFAVCIRCSFFYFAGLVMFAYYFFRVKTTWWPAGVYLVLILPALVDFFAEKIGLYSNFTSLRLITGMLLGIAAFHFLILAISNRRDLAK